MKKQEPEFQAEQFTFDNPPSRLGPVLEPEIKMAIAVDFETFYSKRLKYTVKTMLPEQYAAHELFDPYMISVCDGKNSWSGPPEKFNWSALENHIILNHNSRFDRSIYNEMVKRGTAPHLNISEWVCTANLTSFLCNRRALDSAVEFLYQTVLSKRFRAEADNKHWPQDFSASEQEAMLRYAKDDAIWTWRIWNDYSARWSENERFLSNLTIEQGMRGVQIDRELLGQYIYQTHEMLQNTEALIPWMAEAQEDEWAEFNTKPTATKCIAEQCRRIGIPCAPVKYRNEEEYEDWEDIHSPKYPWILAVGAWRSINKLYQTFMTVKSRLKDDGTLPFSLKYFGAHTGRWSGDAKVNMQNMRKIPVLCNEQGLLEQRENRLAQACEEHEETGNWPGWVRHAIDFRALIIPRPGTKMIVSDLSQIEPRVLAWLSGNHKLLDMIRGGYGVYEAFARANLGYTGPRMDKNSLFYKMVKIQVLGLGYGCGWNKFIKIAAQGGVDITKDDPEWYEEEDYLTGEKRKVSGHGKHSKEIVNKFREQSPQTVALWNALDNGIRQSADSNFVINLPSGRKLTYNSVRFGVRMRLNPATKKLEKKWELTADSDGKRKSFYGGKLTENLVQAVARDVFAAQVVRMQKAGLKNLFSCHDEAILEVDEKVTAKDVEEQMSFCPSWIPGLPVAAEAREVKHYLK